MFKSIAIKNGIKFDNITFDLKKGTTAVMGKNGCGKSLLLEFLAFSLFGAVALRGKVSDYKKLEVTVKVQIKGKDYVITRTTKDCTIMDENDNIICVGTKPCNSKIIELLGYNYSVYKMGNYAEQLDILGLGKMKPAERKQAMDMVLGLGIIDTIAKEANTRSLDLKHQAEGASGILVKPEEPIRPEWYESPDELLEEYNKLGTLIKEYDNTSSVTEPVKPNEPKCPIEMTVVEISNRLNEKTEAEKNLLELNNLKASDLYTKKQLMEAEEQWKQYEAYLNYKQAYTLFDDEDPFLDEDQIADEENHWRLYDEYQVKLKRYELGCVTCPSCGHSFNPTETGESLAEVTPPLYSKETLAKQKELCAKRKARNKIEVVKKVEKPLIDKDTIRSQLIHAEKLESFSKKAEDWMNTIVDTKDITGETLRLRSVYDSELAGYKKDLELYDTLMVTYTEAREKLLVVMNTLVEINKDIDSVRSRWTEIGNKYNQCLLYHQAYSNYLSALNIYEENKAKVESLLEQSGKYKLASDNLKLMKAKIKGFVLPSLASVSSRLLSEMSDGLYNNFSIDEDFNVLVDGKEVSLFSGSEQAMINLALRIGLGQVLTHKVFSVFIGDEIDASMRDERAQLTANCLRKISKFINQVILVSHRDIEADNYLMVGG